MEEFIQHIHDAIDNDIFVKLTLSRSRLPHVKNIYFKLATLKKGRVLNATYRENTQDITKNYAIEEGLVHISELLFNQFGQGILFTLEQDMHIRVSPNGQSKLKHYPPTFSKIPPSTHDKIKERPVDTQQDFLQALGITSAEGKVKAEMQSKYRQINRFIELLTPHLHTLNSTNQLHLVDMGAGKGYLTFAIHNYIANTLNKKIKTIGVELRPHLVELCNDVAQSCNLQELHFEASSIEALKLPTIDILIALHACNTATDDAIFQGINAKAQLIVVAPCCHKQVRQNLLPTNCIKSITQYGIFKERQAELLTDTLRALLLETQGYRTSVVEFIDSEHTAKNIMIIAERRKIPINCDAIAQQIKELKEVFGIKSHYLENILQKHE